MPAWSEVKLLGQALREAGRSIREAERELERLADAHDDDSVRERGYQLWAIALNLRASRRYGRAVPRFEEAEAIFRRFESHREAADRIALDRGLTLVAVRRWEDAADLFDRVVAELGVDGTFQRSVDHNPRNAELVPNAAHAWLSALDHVGDLERTETAADAVIAALDVGKTVTRQAALAEALRLKGSVAHARGDLAAALTALEEAIGRCEGEQDVRFVATGAEATVERAAVLGESERIREAITACDEVVNRFAAQSDVRDAVKKARKLRRKLTKRA